MLPRLFAGLDSMQVCCTFLWLAGVLPPVALVAGLASLAGLLHVSLVGKCVASGSLLASVVPFSHVSCMYLFEFMLLWFRFGA